MSSLSQDVSFRVVSIALVKELAVNTGSQFFSHKNLSIENTRVFHEAIYKSNKYYFVTADRFPWDTKDGYTVRVINTKGNVKVVGEVGEFTTYTKAMSRLKAKLSK